MARNTEPVTMRVPIDLLSVLKAEATAKSVSLSATIEGLLRVALDLPYPAPSNPFAKESK
jgi:hypothetical protein